MLKKIYQKLALSAVLLLTVVAMLATAIGAASTDVYLVTIDYKTTECSVTVKVDDKVVSPNAGTAGEYHIPYNHGTLTIEVTPKPGYALSALTDAETDQEVASTGTDGKTYQPILTKDMSYYIKGSARTYTIEEISAQGMGHNKVFDQISYQYASDDNVTLSVPVLDGYVFTGWKIITNTATNQFTLLTYDGTSETVKFLTTIIPDTGSVLYAEPMWEGTPQNVTRFDYEFGSTIPVNYGNSGVVNTTTWQEPNGTTSITGDKAGNEKDAEDLVDLDQGGYKTYVGYYPYADYANDSKYYTTLAKVTTNPEANKVNRYYVPIVYTLTYEGLADDSAYPKTHTYNVATLFENQPERVGYHFAGWKVYIVKNGERTDITSQINSEVSVIKKLELKAREMCLADGNTDHEIILEATWTPKTYNVTFAWATSDEVTFDTAKYATYTYDATLTIDTLPVRFGYNFEGWTLTTADGTTETISITDGKTLIVGPYDSDLTLTAIWSPKKLTVTLDGNGADSEDHTKTLEATFDAALTLPADFKLPVRIGHTFVGYYLKTTDGDICFISVTEDSDGTLIAKSEITQWRLDTNTTLVAVWTVNSYNVTVEIDTTKANVTITDTDGNGRFDFGEQITVTVQAIGANKLVKWEGESVLHTTSYTYQFTLGATDRVLTGLMLPVVNAPVFKIDYLKEIFSTETGSIPDGRYLITCDGETALEVVVSNGKITVNGGNQQTVVAVLEGYYGKTVQIVTYGVDGVSADSDAQALAIAARPAKPVMNTPTAEIKHIYQYEETMIVIEMTDVNTISRFEFACSESADSTSVKWWSIANADPLSFKVEDGKIFFVNLKPGTEYYVYVRVKAVADEHAHGVEFRTDPAIPTHSDNTLEAKKNAMLDLIEDGDGEMVKTLIDQAIADANALVSPSPDFYDNLEAIYNRVLQGIQFARTQDRKIAELIALRDRLVASGEFSTENVNLINNICEVAVQTIKSATATEAVQAAHTVGMTQMKEVPVTRLVYGDAELIAKDGLPQGSALYQERMENITDLSAAVDTAIQIGKFVYGGSAMTQAEVAEALKSLDVMAAYQMRLTDAASVTVNPAGRYEIRLLLPSELHATTGLQVAYYNQKTGELEVLDTVKDGNCLVFYADRVDGFVILGDPVLRLTGFIVALGLILACQLIGIILLLVRRGKYAKSVRRYSFAMPLLLTIRFLPENGMTLLFVLGGLVILFQIILMYLLLSSEVVYRSKHHHHSTEERRTPAEEDVPVMAEVQEEVALDGEDTAEDSDTDRAFAVFAENREEDFSEDTETLDFEEFVEDEAPETDEDGYAYGEDDFIEPAANPRYSLPDEEFEAYGNSLTEDEALDGEDVTYADEDAAYDDEYPAYDEEAVEEDNYDDAEDGAEHAFDPDGYDTEVYSDETDGGEGDVETWADTDGFVDGADADTDAEGDTTGDGSEGEEIYTEASEQDYDELAYEDDATGDPANDESVYDEEDATGDPAEDFCSYDIEDATGDPANDENVYDDEDEKPYDGYEE
ncbi:MAG: InlB B-repeat-containing protein [Clostridia bacterium]|nr:InlB B-repeat-containing protein [Clostridia bacterium]